jgi:HEAT repeat protein
MEPSITDQEEKEAALAGISAAGSEAIEPIRDYCKKAESLTWPLKVLEEIVPEKDVVEELLAVLDQFDTEYTRNSEPKVQLIALLEKYPTEDVRVAVEPFLGDVNESVRFTAVDTVFAIGNEGSAEALIAALEDEESLRIRNRSCRLMAERNWRVPEDLKEMAAKALPPGFSLDGDLIREA